MIFKSNAITHIGLVRKLNEDAFAERSDIGVWVVADGIGGHAAGEVASKAVTDSIKCLESNRNFDEMLEAVKRSLENANRQLREQTDTYTSKRPPGSTVVVLIINDTKGAVVWVGDSRVYQCRNQKLTQLTRDHSHVQNLLDQGIIKAEDAESHPLSNIITRAIGILDLLQIDSREIEVLPGDQFLLCTDGLSHVVANSQIEAIMQKNTSKEVVQSLLQTTLERGAPDNVTLIHVSDSSD